MYALDYDEFNIYTTLTDVEEYTTNLIYQGCENFDEAYNKCLDHFGQDLKSLVDTLFF